MAALRCSSRCDLDRGRRCSQNVIRLNRCFDVPSNSLRPFTLVLILAAVFISGSIRARACSLCVGFPERSPVDFLLESSAVALAREDPNRPFSMIAFEYLKGSPDGTDLDLFLDTKTRRALATDADRCVVVVRSSTDGTWRRLTLADTEYQELIRRVLILGPQWQDADGSRKRAEFFMPLFGHQDQAIFELAYIEIARAPYDVIRRVGKVVEREQVERILNDRQYLMWRSLTILLLAQDATEENRELIAASFRNAERYDLSINLAAWAAAAIEVDGQRALSFIEEKYLASHDCSSEAMTEILKALSLHGSEGRVDLRDHIVSSYETLLEIHPDRSAHVAADLLAWRRTECSAELSAILDRNADLGDAERRIVRQYVRRAASLEKSGSIED